jgi:AcrR family transcriptional regulator
MSRPADPNAKIDLLRAAEAVFVERGLDHAKVEEITGRAGHSKGAFYLHFGSKEDAFRQIVETMLARLSACLDQSGSPPESRDAATLGAYLDGLRVKELEMFDFVWANRRVVRLTLEGGGSASFGYLIDQFAERSRAHTKRMLAWGIRCGLFRPDLDVELASLFIAGGYDRVARQIVRAERKPDLGALLDQVQRLVHLGLATPALARTFDSPVNNGGRPRVAPPRIQARRPAPRPRARKRSPVP